MYYQRFLANCKLTHLNGHQSGVLFVDGRINLFHEWEISQM